MAGIDFTAEELDLVLLVRASSIVDGAEVVHRWAGPREAAMSGAAVRGAEGDGELYLYEARLALAEDEISAGGLDEHVQVLGQLTLGIAAIEGDAAHDAANRGRWAGRSVVAWAYDRLTGGTQEVFRGVASRGPTALTESGFRLTARDEIAGREAAWPSTQIPTDSDSWLAVAPWTHDPPTTTADLHDWHPNQHANEPTIDADGVVKGVRYFTTPHHRGRFVGPSYADAGGVWVEALPFGYGSRHGFANTMVLCVHLGPLVPMVVEEVVWEDPLAGKLFRWIPAQVGDAYTYENTDPTSGPLGLNCALTSLQFLDYPGPAAGAGIDFHLDPFPRVYVYLVPGAVAAVQPVETDGGRFVLYETAGAVARNIDSEIVEDLFVDLMGRPDLLHPADLVRFATTGPNGPTGVNRWRTLHGRVPPTLGTTAPQLRDHTATLMGAVQSDMVIAYDPTDGRRKFSPRRRRPTPLNNTPDHLVYPHSFVTGGGVDALGWQIDDEPKRRYGTEITIEIESGRTPYIAPTTALADSEIGFKDETTVIVSNATEAGFVGYPINRATKIKDWRASTPSGRADAALFEGSSRTQRQIRITSILGHFALGWELLDLVGFEVATLRHHGPGHVRNVRRDWLNQRATVETYHLEFAADSTGVTVEEHEG